MAVPLILAEAFGADTSRGTFHSETVRNGTLLVHGFFKIGRGATNPLIEVTATEELGNKIDSLPCRDAKNMTLVCFVEEGTTD